MVNNIEIILLVALIVIALWNAFSWHILMRQSKHSSSGLPDARYYELKFHIQLLVGITTILIAVFGFFGFSSIENLKLQVQKEVSLSDTLKARLERYNLIAEKVEASFTQADELETKFRRLGTDVNAIQKKNILKQSYYIVTNITFHPSMAGQTTIFFDKLPSINGQLPAFKNPPIIIAVPDGDILVKTFNVTTQSFDVRPDPFRYDQDAKTDVWATDLISFTLIIFEK